jgi:hypothetical protein
MQYFSYIVGVSFIDGGNHTAQRNCHGQTSSHNFISSTHQYEQVSTNNLSGDRH